MGTPQQRARPRRSSQDTTGTLSRAAMGAPHRGHRLRGRTTDSPAGTRAITTLRKLPTSRPRTAQAVTSTDGTVAAPGVRSAVVAVVRRGCRAETPRRGRRPEAPPASRVERLGSVVGAGDAAGSRAGLQAAAA